jgi:hypothetical protein
LTTPVYPVPEAYDDPDFRWLFEYWLDRHQSGRLPGRGEIDPIEFPKLLGKINLVDVECAESGNRYRFRLWGSKVSHIFGADHSGKYLEEIAAPGTLGDLRERFDICVETREPQFIYRGVSLVTTEKVTTRRLLFPLASDGHAVDMLMSLVLAGDS